MTLTQRWIVWGVGLVTLVLFNGFVLSAFVPDPYLTIWCFVGGFLYGYFGMEYFVDPFSLRQEIHDARY